MRRIDPWLAPLLILGIGCAYFLFPRFALSINQVCEMLLTGNTRGIMMVLHSAGTYAAIASVGIGCIAFLVLPMKPRYLLLANTGYFGQLQGIILTVLGSVVAVLILTFIWHTLWTMLPEPGRRLLKQILLHELSLPAFLSILMLSRVF